eukprot:gb/GEZN01015219.1/.p2 GENE.gb/GEZN01015219.1/~~gb/GEZN01015219.1/.p2  ORF type:complete len:210 (+),score=31.22 gb/GEZN01015219.1/:60-689(+)
MEHCDALCRGRSRVSVLANRRATKISLQGDMADKCCVHYYELVGRRKPTDKIPTPQIYRMKIFAANPVEARSRFWYYMRNLKRVKKANGELLSESEIFEKNPNSVKNFGIWLRYDSRSGTHNMYKEFRSTTLVGAVEQMYQEMAARHRARKHYIQIIRTAVVKGEKMMRPSLVQYIDSKIKFQVLHRINRASHKRYRSTFKAVKPTTFF